jgi:peptidoglycan/xylan/chitin deacetylase (PgdA/CDA1 family)
MKAVMYHYVREFNPKLPFFRYLDIKNFKKQLDHFGAEYGFVSKEEWIQALSDKKLGNAKGKILLTFDDAMSCHYDYVFRELKKRDLWGIFYVPTKPYHENKILDVHRIHLLCGAFEGIKLIGTLKVLLNESMIKDKKITEFRENTYTRQENYEGISEFKRILNYFVSYKHRESLIDAVANDLGYKFNASDFYVPVEKLREMYLSGNIIGSHTVSHPVMSKLSENKQRSEINKSLLFLNDNAFIDIKTYCHPYGGFHSFNEVTIKVLDSYKVAFSFNVESRDIQDKDLRSSVQFLPRYDCNEFPFGKAS